MNSSKHKILVLIFYYGEFPWYFSYFLHSCKFNSTIDFLIFTDIIHEFELPENVTIIKKSLVEIKEIASEKLGFEVSLEFPYKICDYRPAYGVIFTEFIQGYDFWAQGDIDVIYGDIRNFMTEDILNEYDFISMRHDFTTGCFALYRNTDLMNNIFKISKDYKKVFSTHQHFAFDEFNFSHHLLDENKSVFDIKTEIESFTYIIKYAEKNNLVKAYFDFILLEGVPGKIKFDNGKIIYKNKFEAILYHLYWLKRTYNPEKFPKKIPDTYFISPSRIYF